MLAKAISSYFLGFFRAVLVNISFNASKNQKTTISHSVVENNYVRKVLFFNVFFFQEKDIYK